VIGCAHAGRFNTALALIFGEDGLTAEQIETRADVTREKVPNGFRIGTLLLAVDGSEVCGPFAAARPILSAFHHGRPHLVQSPGALQKSRSDSNLPRNENAIGRVPASSSDRLKTVFWPGVQSPC
jgi:hypothetical protein